MVPRYRASIAKLCQLGFLDDEEKENWDTFYNDEAMNKKVFNLVANLPKPTRESVSLRILIQLLKPPSTSGQRKTLTTQR